MLTPPTRLVKKNPKTLIVFLTLFTLTLSIQVLITFAYVTVTGVVLNLASALCCLVSLGFAVC